MANFDWNWDKPVERQPQRGQFDWSWDEPVEARVSPRARKEEPLPWEKGWAAERAHELIRPKGGIGMAAVRTGLGAGESARRFMTGSGMLLSNILPHEMEMKAQRDILDRASADAADFERRLREAGGRDIYSGIGTLIPDVAALVSVEGAAVRLAPRLALRGGTMLSKVTRGAARGSAVGAAYETIKEGDVRAAPEGAVTFGVLGALAPPLGSALSKSRVLGGKLIKRYKIDEAIEKAKADWWTNAAFFEKNFPKLAEKYKTGILGSRGKAAQAAEDHLAEAFAPVKNDARLMKLAVERAQVKHTFDVQFKTGREVGEKALKTMQEHPSRFAKLAPEEQMSVEQAAEGLRGASDRVLNYWLENRVISQEQFNIMKDANPFHVPLNRVFAVGELREIERTTGKKLASGYIRRMVGSEREIDNVAVNIMRNHMEMMPRVDQHVFSHEAMTTIANTPEFAHLVKSRAITKPVKGLNQKIDSLVKEARLEGHEKDIAKQAYGIFRVPVDTANNEIAVLRNGKWNIWTIDTSKTEGETILKIFRGAQSPADFSKAWRFMTAAKTLKRAGITLAPAFSLRNALRDMMMSLVIDPNITAYNVMPSAVKRFMYDFPRAVVQVSRNTKFMESLRRAGAMGAEFHPADRKALEANLRKLAGVRAFTLRDLNPFTYMEKVARVIEQAPRYIMAENVAMKAMGKTGRRAIREGKVDQEIMRRAALLFREGTADFAEMGWKAKVVGEITPFFTAGFAGNRTLWRAIKRDPTGTAAKVFQLVTMPSVALWMLNHDKEWYRALSPVQKNMFWWITPHIAIPKPWEIGLIGGSLIERALDTMYDANPKEAMDAARSIGMAFPDVPIPAGVGTAIGWAMNKDMFFKSTIVPKYKTGLPKYLQTKSATSETAKAIGKTINVAPAVVDWAISDIAGGMGRHGVRLSDFAVEKITPAKEVRPARGLAGVPGIRGVVKPSPLEVPYSGAIQQFYDNYYATDKRNKEINRLKKEGRYNEAVTVYKQNAWQMRAYDSFLKRVRKRMTELSEVHRELSSPHKFTHLTPEEKAERQKRLAKEMNRLAMIANSQYDELRKIGI